MKIKKIVLYNVGPYVGENVFEIDCNNKDKNIILIGGKNGAGKTTFFTSLRTCIYGHRAYGYESTNQHYYEEIYKLINDNQKSLIDGYAKVELDLLFDDGMYNNVYTITREWSLKGKKVKETYRITLNEVELVGDELLDFENYLLHIIPPNLFKFYFFDGEKIGDFFLQSNQDNSFKNAFLTMTGYDNIELLLKNFKRIVSQNSKGSSKSDKYFELQNQIESLEESLMNLKNQLNDFNNCLVEKNDELVKLEKDYHKSGGVTLEDWNHLNKAMVLEENKREEYHRLRKDFVNTEIPYLILKDKILELEKQIEIEEKIIKKEAIVDLFSEENIDKILSSVNNITSKLKTDVSNALNNFIHNSLGSIEGNIVLGLSAQERNELISQIEKHKNFDSSNIKTLSDLIKKSKNDSQKLRKQMEKSNVDFYEDFFKAKNDIINEKTQIESNISKIQMEIFKNQTNLDSIQSEYKKVKKEYEEELKKESVNDISSRALLAFSSVSDDLLRTQIDKVESNFKKVFKKIINKKDFINEIKIDEKLNIYPYKNVRLDKKYIKSILKNPDIKNEMFGEYELSVIDKYMDNEDDYIDVPMEIKSPFSQGEKQVYIMSIYLALMQISRVEVPFVIDTPFARIDKEHRHNIIDNFFTKLKGQVFILSTDEEINNTYTAKLSDKVSEQYLLKFESRGKTEVLKNQYFGGMDNGI